MEERARADPLPGGTTWWRTLRTGWRLWKGGKRRYVRWCQVACYTLCTAPVAAPSPPCCTHRP